VRVSVVSFIHTISEVPVDTLVVKQMATFEENVRLYFKRFGLADHAIVFFRLTVQKLWKFILAFLVKAKFVVVLPIVIAVEKAKVAAFKIFRAHCVTHVDADLTAASWIRLLRISPFLAESALF